MSEEFEITRILERLKRGDSGAREDLLRCIFAELHTLAQGYMRAQPGGHTLQPTALVHEAYLRLFHSADPSLQDRGHFLRAAARAMRCVLIDHARAKGRLKRTGAGERVPLEGLGELFEERAEDLLELDEALGRLAAVDPRAAEVVELRFFGGRTDDEVAELLDVSKRTVERDWAVARAWLRRELA